jgi:ribonucleoside-diphosphate reductase alpha chain
VLARAVQAAGDGAERLGIEFDSDEAVDLMDRLVEFISWHAIDASAELAKVRGSFPKFEGSDWSKGIVPIDTLPLLDKERIQPVEVNRDTRLNWDNLRERVAEGMRNGTIMAIAPTATISLMAGTSQSLEPPFANVYARNNISGKFLEVNENLVQRLKELDLWEDVCEEILHHQGWRDQQHAELTNSGGKALERGYGSKATTSGPKERHATSVK